MITVYDYFFDYIQTMTSDNIKITVLSTVNVFLYTKGISMKSNISLIYEKLEKK